MNIDAVYIDDLTGVLNRRYLYEHLQDEIEFVERHGKSLWMAIIDIDNFKAINDTYGHLEGDNILREVASIFRRSIRMSDKVIRFGGDEFILLLIDGGLVSALTVLKRIRENVSRQRFSTGIAGMTIEVTISIGLAGYPEDTTDVNKLLNLADEALYIAKSRGKSGIALVSDIPIQTLLHRDILELFPLREFVCREKEISALKNFLSDREQNILVISGQFGVGKSRFLQEAEVVSSMHGFIPFYTATYGKEPPILYDLWQHFESKYLDIYPDLLEVFSVNILDEVKQYRKGEMDSKRVILSIEQLIRKVVSQYNIVFLLDDLIYVDEETLWTIVRLVSNYRGKIKVVFSLDSDFNSSQIDSLFSIFEERFIFEKLTIPVFTLEEIEKYVKTVFSNPVVSPGIYEIFYSVTHGNLMFLEELLKFLISMKSIYRVHHKWIFKSPKDISSLIEGLSFESIVIERIKNLDGLIKEEMFKLHKEGKNISQIWKVDLGVVKKGYLLDLVKTLQRSYLLKDRTFYIEDFPNVAVKEIFDIISSLDESMAFNEGLSETSLDGSFTLHAEMTSVLKGVDNIDRLSMTPLLKNNISNFLSCYTEALKLTNLADMKSVLPGIVPRCFSSLLNLWKDIGVVHFSIRKNKLLINGNGASYLHADVAASMAEFLKLIGTEDLYLMPNLIQEDILYLIWLNFFSATDSDSYSYMSPYVFYDVNGFIYRNLIVEFMESFKVNTLPQSMDNWLDLSMALYNIFLILVQSEDSGDKLTKLRGVLESYPIFYRMWLWALFVNYKNWGISSKTKQFILTIQGKYTAMQLSILYQHKKVSFQFVKRIYDLYMDAMDGDFVKGLDANLLKILDDFEGIKGEHRSLKKILSLSDLDRWGEVIIEDIRTFVSDSDTKVQDNMLNLLIDSLEMSLSDMDLSFIVISAVPDLISALYEKGYSELARKMWKGLINAMMKYDKVIPRHMLLNLKLSLAVILRKEKEHKMLYSMLKLLDGINYIARKKLLSDAEILAQVISLIDSFFDMLSEDQKELEPIVKIIFYIGRSPMRLFIKRLVVSEDISSFGYFDLFWARRLVGENIPEEIREEIVDYLTIYLNNKLWYVVRNAIELLSYILKPSEIGILRPLIYHENDRVRKRLLFILSRLKTKEADNMLLDMLKASSDFEIKEKIYRILKKSSSQEILSQLELYT